MKRLCAVLLCFVMCFQVIAIPAEAWYEYVVSGIPDTPANTDNTMHKYSPYWQYWSQAASKYQKMRDCGCRVVAQSKLLVETGVVSSDVNTFNPDLYLEWGMSQGFWPYADNDINEQTETGLAAITYAANHGVTLNKGYVALSGGNSDADVQSVMDYINAGYYVILHSSAHQAYVGRAASLNAGTPIILNSWNNKSTSPYLCESFSGHTLTYFTGFYYYAVNSDIPVTMSWINGTQTPKETDAYVYMEACANISGTFQEAGITVWNEEKNAVIAQKSEVPDSSAKSLLQIWYNITEETGVVLNPGTTYLYQYHVKFNGSYYYSPVYDITTTGACSCTYGPWTIDSEATCTENGSRSRVCTKCGSIEVEILPATNHEWKLTEQKDQSCEEDGYNAYICSACGQTKTDVFEAFGHDWQESGRVEATCQQVAGVIYTCFNCGESNTKFSDGEFSEWSETYPEGVKAELIETATQYRYRDQETITSSEPVVEGYELVDTTWQDGTESYMDYVPSWPAGFDTSHSLYHQYNKTPVTNSETDTQKITLVSSNEVGYIYWHWCRGSYTAGPIDRKVNDVWTSEFCAFHAFYSTTHPSTLQTVAGGGHLYSNSACCVDSYWYYYTPVARLTYITQNVGYIHSRWMDWSDWSTTVYEGTETRQVESREVYRYAIGGYGDHTYESVVTEPTCTEQGFTTHICSVCGDSYTDNYTDTIDHSYTSKATEPTCTEKGFTTYTCSCGDTYKDDEVAELGHKWDDGVVTREPTAAAHGVMTYTCERCKETKTEDIPYEGTESSSVQRIYGQDRIETALAVAAELKSVLKVEKFDFIILAAGGSGSDQTKFADALSGSYLATSKGAPILLYTKGNLSPKNLAFIEENLSDNGIIYLLGGNASIPEEVEEALVAEGYTTKRLGGTDRYDTNLIILQEAGIADADEILVASGRAFADSLSASATGLPIMLVNGTKTELTEAQVEFLQSVKGKKITILGGTAAVTAELEAAINEAADTEADRIFGNARENTSAMVAQKYFADADTALIAYSKMYPDGLAGGVLANALHAPLLLTKAGSESIAREYIEESDISSGYVLGGTAVLTDETARAVFDLSNDVTIITK